MYTLILISHIAVAVVTLGAAGKSAHDTYSARHSSAKGGLVATWVALGATSLTGGVMALLAPQVVGRVCVSMVVTIALVTAVQLYYARVTKLASRAT